MKASCSVTTSSRRFGSLPLIAAGAMLVLACGAVSAQSSVQDPVPSFGAGGRDPFTPVALSPLLQGERVLWPVSDNVTFGSGYGFDRSGAPLALDAGACDAGILEIGCGPGLAPGALATASPPGRFDVGARWRPLEGFTLGLDYFQDDGSGRAGAMLLPRMLDFIAPGWYSALQQGGHSEGVDLNLAYGFDAGLIGELELNVQLSHVLDLTPPMASRTRPGVLSTEPFTEASIGFNWTRGNFSGTLSSQYTDGLMLDGQLQPIGMTTVDINFAWRTPWNASFSVGAQNLLGQQELLGSDFVAPPELDSAFSRVPYVRYEQDL